MSVFAESASSRSSSSYWPAREMWIRRSTRNGNGVSWLICTQVLTDERRVRDLLLRRVLGLVRGVRELRRRAAKGYASEGRRARREQRATLRQGQRDKYRRLHCCDRSAMRTGKTDCPVLTESIIIVLRHTSQKRKPRQGVFLRQHRMQGLENRLRGGFDGSFPLMLQTVVG